MVSLTVGITQVLKSGIHVTNDEIGAIFLNIGHLLQIQGEDSFRARIYERAADTIENLDIDLGQLAEEGRLQSIPGIGKAIEGKIVEMLETGQCRFYENLIAEMGEEVLDLLRIRGVGVKTAARFYNELGVKNLLDLRTAIDGGRFKLLKGIGSKTIVQIDEGLRFLEVQDRMRPLWRILPIARAIIQILRDAPGIARADFTGEMRRHEEMLHRLELAVECTSPATIVDALSKVGGVKGFETAKSAVTGGQCVEASVDYGFPLRVYAFDREEYEAGMLITTASAEHLTALNGVAETHNLEKSEEGLSDWMRGKTESSIYDAVALPLIPPELRRDGASIEAAAAGALPTLIELSDIRGDLHMHTEWSDGRHSMRDMVGAAKACGLDYIAITDHSVSSRVANGLTLERLLAHMNEVRSINAEVSGIEVLAGSEVDILNDGSLDYADDVLAQLDIVVASVHAGFNMSEADMTKRMIRAIENPYVNIIGHPTGRLLGRRPGYALNLDAVIQAAAEHGVVLEINASSNRLDLEPDMARKANEAGVLLTINTDAHAVPQLQQTHFGINVARRAWLTKDAVINTYSLDELHELFRVRNP